MSAQLVHSLILFEVWNLVADYCHLLVKLQTTVLILKGQFNQKKHVLSPLVAFKSCTFCFIFEISESFASIHICDVKSSKNQ